MEKIKLKNEKGITLIALIITIIILVILAAVSINAAYNSGIINYAVNGTQNYVTGAKDEESKIESANSVLTSVLARLENLGENKVPDITQYQWKRTDEYEIEDYGTITFDANGNCFMVDEPTLRYSIAGNVLRIIFAEDDDYMDYIYDGRCFIFEDDDYIEKIIIDVFGPIMAQAKANRVGNEAIGIGTDGSIVDLSLWRYEPGNEPGTIHLGIGAGSQVEKAYKGPYVNGRIEGTMPQYILMEGAEEFSTVTSLAASFWYDLDLVYAPDIPETVVDLKETFCECSALITAPVVPASVRNLESTFQNCSSLTGDLVINAQYIPDDGYQRGTAGCLSNCAKNVGCNLQLSGSSPYLDEILATANLEESHISIKE